MDYLVSEGFPRAAEKFAKEANIQFPLEEESIESRVEIRQAIHAGDIDTAITKINDLNPQVCYVYCLISILQDYIQFHAPRIISLMIIKPSVLSMNCKLMFLSNTHQSAATIANRPIRSLTQTPPCTLHCSACSSLNSFGHAHPLRHPTSHPPSTSHRHSLLPERLRTQSFSTTSS
jgi:hypothetical protein